MIILCMYRNEKKKNFEIRIFTFFCENKKKTKFNDDNFGIEKKRKGYLRHFIGINSDWNARKK